MIRSFVFACLTALAATLAAQYAAATEFIENPPRSEAVLDWSTSEESLQTQLHRALSTLVASDPSRAGGKSVLQATPVEFALSDAANRIYCQSTFSIGVIESNSFRCTFNLASSHLDWTAEPNSIQGVLFDSLDALSAKEQPSPTLIAHERADSRVLRLVDENTASKIVCEKHQGTPTISGAEYRCLIDIRP